MTEPVTPEVAALGVDTDCGPCANGGIERLAEARPDIDWVRLVHDTQDHEVEDWKPYWCEVCAGD